MAPPLTIEINFVPRLGYYLEIEHLAKNKQDIPKAKQRIEKAFRHLGFNRKQFEKRYYLDLLAAKKAL